MALEAKGVDYSIPNTNPEPTLLRSGGRGPKPLSALIVDGLLTVTPDLAHRIIQTEKFDRQRPVRPKHVDALAMQMKRREWTAGTQIHFGRTPDGELHLVNGQHRMHAVVKAATSISFQILVTDVTSPDDLIRLYRRHDRLIAHRTVSDALVAEGIQDKYQLSTMIARGTFGAVAFIGAGFRFIQTNADPYIMRSDEARLRIAEEWWPIAQVYQDAIERAPAKTPPIKRYLMQAGIMAVGLVTLRDQEVKAYAFWQGTADNDGLRRSDARSAFLNFLRSGDAKSQVLAAKGASLAWNAFFADEELSSIRAYKTEILIAGTAFAKPRKD